jgi:enoyl-CoA hydratase/carnithine racemase
VGYETVLTELRDDGILVITLNRPQARNALNSKMWQELSDVFWDADADQAVRAIIMTHVGDVFCAGADLKELKAGTWGPPRGREDWGFAGMTAHYVAKPLIAAVNGKAFGGGAEIMLTADLAVISADGMIGFPEVARALTAAGGGGLLRLGRSIPVKRAMEMLLTGQPVSAQTALEWGLVNRVVEPGQALDAAIELGQAIVKNGPLAVARTKQAVYECMDKPWLASSDGWRMMFEIVRTMDQTEDAKEGQTAFAEKRPPVWAGR